MLKMSNISKVYRTELVETHALRELDLHVEEGEFVAVTGPSGSGKTTFLNIAGLLESPSSGVYELDGEDVSQRNDKHRSRVRNEKIGFIFQSFNLIPDLSLADNVDVPLRYRGWSAGKPRFLLADEPTGNLDSEMASVVMNLLESINDEGTTIVMVTHDPDLAHRASRNIHILDGRASDLGSTGPANVTPLPERGVARV
jgi:putative ABC transport system ATP-binding protein